MFLWIGLILYSLLAPDFTWIEEIFLDVFIGKCELFSKERLFHLSGLLGLTNSRIEGRGKSINSMLQIFVLCCRINYNFFPRKSPSVSPNSSPLLTLRHTKALPLLFSDFLDQTGLPGKNVPVSFVHAHILNSRRVGFHMEWLWH